MSEATVQALVTSALSTRAGHRIFTLECERLALEGSVAREAEHDFDAVRVGAAVLPEQRAQVASAQLSDLSDEQRQALDDVALDATFRHLITAARILMAGRDALGGTRLPDPSTVAMLAALDATEWMFRREAA